MMTILRNNLLKNRVGMSYDKDSDERYQID